MAVLEKKRKEKKRQEADDIPLKQIHLLKLNPCF